MNHHHRLWPRLLLGLTLAGSLTACNLEFGKDGSPSADPPPGPAPAPAPGPAPAPSPDPAPARAALTFSGQVIDAPIANAAVTVNAGGMTFHGTADADGRYSIAASILASEVGSPVSIDAVGSATQPSVRFTSRLGSFSRLQAAAGSDAVLDASENFRVNVTNFSTAEAALVEETTELPADADLDSRLMAIDYEAVTDLATAISLVVDDGVPLPAGVTDTLALARAPAPRAGFIASQRGNGTRFADARSRLLANRAIVMGATAATVPGTVYAITTVTPVPEDVYTYGSTERFDFAADGTGRYLGDTQVGDSHYSSSNLLWMLVADGSIADGSIAVGFSDGGPQGPPFEETVSFADDGTPVKTTCHFQVVGLNLLPLSATTAKEERLTQRLCADTSLNQTYFTTETKLFVKPEALPVASAADIAGRSLTVPTINAFQVPTSASVLVPVSTDLASFNPDGSGRLKLSEQDFSWTIGANGALRMSYPDGSSGEIRTVRQLVDNVVLQFGEFTKADGSSLIGRSLRTAADGIASVDRATFSGVFYEYGLGSDSALASFGPNGEPLGVSPLQKGLAFEFYSDGLAGLRFDSVQPQADGSLARVPRRSRYIDYWTVRSDGSLNYQRYDFNGGIDLVGSCGIDSTNAGCDRFRNDDYFPLASSGNRRFWLMRFNGDGAVQPFSRAVFWDGAPNGDYELPRTDIAAAATARRVPAQATSAKPALASKGREQ